MEEDLDELIDKLVNSASARTYRLASLHPIQRTKDTSRGNSNYQKHEAAAFERKDKEGYWWPIPDYPHTKFKQGQPLWGYRRDPEHPGMLVPVPEQLERLEEAKEYVKRYSFDTVARWLSAITGRRISYNELYDRVNHGWDRDKRAAVLRRWAIRFKKAIEAAQRIEKESVDAGERKCYTEEGSFDLRQKASFLPTSAQPRAHPDDFDDGTPSEAQKPSKKTHAGKPRRPGPRRPRRSRAQYRDTPTPGKP